MITVTWDQTAAVNTAISEGVSGSTCGVASFNITGSITAGQINFEVSDDGVHWYSNVGIVQGSFTIFTNWQPSFGASFALQFNLSGFQFWRFRIVTVLTGTGTVTVLANSFSNTPFLSLLASVQQNAANLQAQTSAIPVSLASGAFSSNFINATGAAINIKNTSGNLYGLTLTNNTAAVAFVEFFNTAAVPTLGTTAVVFCVEIPASQSITLPPSEIALMNFTTGIGFAATTTENGATTASVTGMIFWK